MLQNIRERAQGFVAWTIILLICLTFSLWGVHSYLNMGKGSSSKTDVIAKVDHNDIEQSQLSIVYERMRQQEQMQLGADYTNNPIIETRLKKQALNQLIMSDILSQAAISDGYRISDKQIDAAILKMPAFQVDGVFSKDRFQEILSSTLYTQDAFLADLYRALLISQVQAGFVESGFVLPGDLEQAIRLVNQRRSISYLLIPLSKFMPKASANNEAAMEFYRRNQDKFAVPEQIKVAYLELAVPEISAKLQFDEADLHQFYKDNLNVFTKPESWRVAHILIKVPQDASRSQVELAQQRVSRLQHDLDSGRNFSAVAEKYSDDVLSAPQGGALAWMSRDSLEPQFEQAMSSLKVGEVSQPVRTKYGFHLIKLLGKKPAEVPSFNKVKRQVQAALSQQKAEQILAAESDKLSSLTYANPNSLSVASQALNIPIKTTEFFTHDGAREGMASNPKFVAAAFSSDVLRGNNSDMISINPQKLVVLRVQERSLATTKPFQEVKDRILLQLRAKDAQRQAIQLGQSILKEVKSGESLSRIARAHGVALESRQDVGRFASTVNPLILSAAFRLPKPTDDSTSSKGMTLPNGGFLVLVVREVRDGQPGKQSAIEKRIFQQQFESKNGQVDYQLYVHDLLNRAKVSILDESLKDKAGASSH
jgi:peptidyl-prolyl cis-trans isomerase D